MNKSKIKSLCQLCKNKGKEKGDKSFKSINKKLHKTC